MSSFVCVCLLVCPSHFVKNDQIGTAFSRDEQITQIYDDEGEEDGPAV